MRFNSRAHPIPDRTNNQFALRSAEDSLAASRSILLFLLFQNRQSLSHTFPVVVNLLTLTTGTGYHQTGRGSGGN